jgi:hypothetical protein
MINLLRGIISNFTVHIRDAVRFLILFRPVSVSGLLVFRPNPKIFSTKYASTSI